MLKFAIISVAVVSALVFLIPSVVWLVMWISFKCCGLNISYAPFGWCAFALVAVLWVMLLYGYFEGRFKLDINRVEYVNASLPLAFEGYKIVQISDLHLDSFGKHKDALERVVDSINSLNPDLVCFTGDFVNLNPDAAKPYLSILRGIKAKDGILSVLGNHDFFIYSRQFLTDEERSIATDKVVEIERSLGWCVLRNDNKVLRRGEDSLTVIGVDNINMGNQGFKTIQRGDLDKAMAGTNGFRILLSHDPTHWRGQVIEKTDIPLTLSGHTHAAQMRLFGWTPASFMFPDAQGFSRVGDRTLYVNIGIGCTLPYRAFANPEITELVLRK